jgi:tetratricopeptide (TPR) repeat protein
MAEVPERPEVGGGASPGVDPAAVALAMGSASRAEADAFLRDQRGLIAKQCSLADDQCRHLHEQLKQIHLDVWEKRLGVLLRVATAFIGVAIAAAMAWLVWNAAHSQDLIMDSFSVPVDMADKGMTGTELAGDLSGRISDMLASHDTSMRAPQSYANNFGDSIKIEIPQTGVSLSELDRFLRDKLGHDVHIAGAVVHTSKGLKLTARAGALGSASVEGPESELDSLQQRLAEAIFGITQPYRYGLYLITSNRFDEANAVFRRLANGDSLRERAWGYTGLSSVALQADAKGERNRVARDLAARAVEIDPGNAQAMGSLKAAERLLGQWEQALADNRKALELLSRPDRGQVRADRVRAIRLVNEGVLDQLLGAFHEAAQKEADAEVYGVRAVGGQSAFVADEQVGEHDLGAARATLANPQEFAPGYASEGELFNERERTLIAMSAGDWGGALKRLPFSEAILARTPSFRLEYHLDTDPYIAFALAKLGRFGEAEKLVADMPADCYPCLIARAQVAELEGGDARADWWFARAESIGPSIPFADEGQGRALLARGKLDAAIEKFTQANRLGPHFADALEDWGEALMAKNQSHLALAKFAEAQKYAPNWGRLHLKWGEALVYAGKRDEAKAQFARAGQLDLTASEKADLAGMNP